MRLQALRAMMFLALIAPSPALAATPKPCVTTEEAVHMTGKDICVKAHVYAVVELPDGTRFLDLCAPGVPDSSCLFTVISLREDRDEVGELNKYRDMDVKIRGIVRAMHGRAGLFLSQARQFNGGPPRFRPNPQLARGFNGSQDRPPLSDPNLRTQGGRRAFMNSKQQEERPAQ